MNTDTKPSTSRNQMTVTVCLVFLAMMFGLAYASVPLYDLFCRVTGYGGTTQVAETNADQVLERALDIRFDANIAGGLPWEFTPSVRQIRLQVGKTQQVNYRFTNTSRRPTTGTSTFNVTPQAAGAYFNKLECFCFTEQVLQPGESVDMPVVFFIDPAIEEDNNLDYIHTITLSYTFFPVSPPAKPQAQIRDRENQEKLAQKF